MTKHKQTVYFSLDNKSNWHKVWKIFIEMKNVFKVGGKDFEVNIDYKGKTPTNNQRSYYRAVIIPTVKKRLIDLGNEDYRPDTKEVEEAIHDLLRKQTGFYEVKKTQLSNKPVSFLTYKTTSNAGEKEDTTAFINACIRWSAEMLDIQIPDALEMGYKFNINK